MVVSRCRPSDLVVEKEERKVEEEATPTTQRNAPQTQQVPCMHSFRAKQKENLRELCHTPEDFARYARDLVEIRKHVCEILDRVVEIDMNRDEQFLYEKLQTDYQTNIDAVNTCINVLAEVLPTKKITFDAFRCLYPGTEHVENLAEGVKILEHIFKDLNGLPFERAQTLP
jgi:hypothetical protein